MTATITTNGYIAFQMNIDADVTAETNALAATRIAENNRMGVVVHTHAIWAAAIERDAAVAAAEAIVADAIAVNT
jgi:hypothetical protein